MKVYIGDKLVMERSKGTTVKRIMEILGLLEEEYLPIDCADGLPKTPDYRVPDDGAIKFLPTIEMLR
ncbi:MAG TPA: hypothetical protein ENL24_04695 [candidate division Zixibacteria bacterium]|nr:hypothetical protein [candidate division Zixibacteria bacterium]